MTRRKLKQLAEGVTATKKSYDSLYDEIWHFSDPRIALATLSKYGCGSKPMVPFSGRCTTHFSLV